MLECESVRFPVLLVFFSDMGRPLSEPWPVATFEELFREEIPASVFGSSPSMSKFVFFPHCLVLDMLQHCLLIAAQFVFETASRTLQGWKIIVNQHREIKRLNICLLPSFGPGFNGPSG